MIETSPNIEEVFEQIKNRVEPILQSRVPRPRTNPQPGTISLR